MKVILVAGARPNFMKVGPVVLYFGHIMSDFVWYSFVSLLLWQGKKLLVGWGLKVLILVCAAFLIYLGIVFVSDGLSGELAGSLDETMAIIGALR